MKARRTTISAHVPPPSESVLMKWTVDPLDESLDIVVEQQNKYDETYNKALAEKLRARQEAARRKKEELERQAAAERERQHVERLREEASGAVAEAEASYTTDSRTFQGSEGHWRCLTADSAALTENAEPRRAKTHIEEHMSEILLDEFPDDVAGDCSPLSTKGGKKGARRSSLTMIPLAEYYAVMKLERVLGDFSYDVESRKPANLLEFMAEWAKDRQI